MTTLLLLFGNTSVMYLINRMSDNLRYLFFETLALFILRQLESRGVLY